MNSNFSYTNFKNAFLATANLSNAYLVGANLSHTDLNGANVENALFGYNKGLSKTTKLDIQLRGAIFIIDSELYSVVSEQWTVSSEQ